MDEARQITGTRDKVANDPFDGSMFGYATMIAGRLYVDAR